MGKKSKSRPKSLPAHKVAVTVSSQTLPALKVPATVRNIQTAATITVATQLSNHWFEVLLREARESGCQEGLAVGVSERQVLQEKLEELQGEVRRLEKELRDEKERKELREGEEKEGEITRNDGPPFDWATDVDTTGPARTQHDTSALHSGARNPWGSLNRRHWCSTHGILNRPCMFHIVHTNMITHIHTRYHTHPYHLFTQGRPSVTLTELDPLSPSLACTSRYMSLRLHNLLLLLNLVMEGPYLHILTLQIHIWRILPHHLHLSHTLLHFHPPFLHICFLVSDFSSSDEGVAMRERGTCSSRIRCSVAGGCVWLCLVSFHRYPDWFM
jgi:hypothetical protein